MLCKIGNTHIPNATLGKSLPAQMTQDSPSLWLRAWKAHEADLDLRLSLFLFIFGTLFPHLLALPALPVLEASLFTLMCCEHSSWLFI